MHLSDNAAERLIGGIASGRWTVKPADGDDIGGRRAWRRQFEEAAPLWTAGRLIAYMNDDQDLTRLGAMFRITRRGPSRGLRRGKYKGLGLLLRVTCLLPRFNFLPGSGCVRDLGRAIRAVGVGCILFASALWPLIFRRVPGITLPVLDLNLAPALLDLPSGSICLVRSSSLDLGFVIALRLVWAFLAVKPVGCCGPLVFFVRPIDRRACLVFRAGPDGGACT